MNLVENTQLSNYTSLKTGGPAAKLIKAEPGDDLAELVQSANLNSPIWVLGYGTNCLISDMGLPGTVILNRSGNIDKLTPTRFKVGSGFNWDQLVRLAIEDNLWGLEFTSAIPGGVGAAVAGNIAAYGHKVADTFIEATVLDSQTGVVETWENNKFHFDYRSSILHQSENKNKVILDATFELSTQATADLQYDSALKVAAELGVKSDSLANRRRIIIEARRRAGSLLSDSAVGPWTAGSFFKNPLVDESQVEKIIAHDESGISREQLLRQNLIHGQNKARVSAAHVLLAAGFRRGQTWGQVRLHPEHVLKVENLGGATAQEIYNIVQQIINTVHEKLGIVLEPEVRFLGEF